ncbi:hypothetical protein GA0070606_1542 [Micromonospora citrea]|uniref:Uncharacterized protein n=1 Tax=Micromonospora citrea TaxID=47855 RepID=A0A1C6U7G8_9ACTN|nr:hypothetical protein [Micromonospora citrea]SCL49861.1 hypothetical protein GA0070606_1542 [Micromonospora citrea]
MATVWRYALRTGAVAACLTGATLAAPPPASAAFSTELSGLPDEFTGGGRVTTVSAVVSRDAGGCVKVRWSMVLRVRGIRLDQVRMDRIEETGSFPLEIRTDGDVARLTDRRLDPGTLCPGRTVTARYRLAFAEEITRGRITLEAEAYDRNLRLLSRQTATRSVVGPAGDPTPTPEPDPAPSEPGEPATEPAGPPAADEPATDAAPSAAGAGRPVARSGGFGVVQAAFLLGGLLLSLGAGLLLRLRQLTRATGPDGDDGPVDDVGPARRWERPAVARRWRPAGR